MPYQPRRPRNLHGLVSRTDQQRHRPPRLRPSGSPLGGRAAVHFAIRRERDSPDILIFQSEREFRPVGTGVCREKEAVGCPGEGPGSGTGLQTLNGPGGECRVTPSSPRHPSTGICRKASPPGGSRSGRRSSSGHEDRSIPCWRPPRHALIRGSIDSGRVVCRPEIARAVGNDRHEAFSSGDRIGPARPAIRGTDHHVPPTGNKDIV